ncbi:hypothetical protein RRG08_029521 [Elysia crispata]|uniref:Uncharacterized protein n=1 Tax=Elysia crispata TaxID=231223 RepID=A0AAE0XW04_9GAST|nr:hypothetical protein RRG08_029521 [Elysia crispata]
MRLHHPALNKNGGPRDPDTHLREITKDRLKTRSRDSGICTGRPLQTQILGDCPEIARPPKLTHTDATRSPKLDINMPPPHSRNRCVTT